MGFNSNNPWGDDRSSNLNEQLDKIKKDISKYFLNGRNMGFKIFFVLLIFIGLWSATGIYRVGTGQKGIVLIFGKARPQLIEPGLHWNFPTPIGSVETPDVARVRRLDIGFRAGYFNDSSDKNESLMITGDQNIVDLNFAVFWRISSAYDYLFSVRNPELIIKSAAESAMREVMGQTKLQSVLTSEKQRVIDAARTRMQSILDGYNTGIHINNLELLDVNPPSQVIDAFDEVQRARQDKDRSINEALAYRNKIVPEARGQASKIIEAAKAYKQQQVTISEGEAARFSSVYEAYKEHPLVTRERLYLENMELLLQNNEKTVISDKNVLTHFPLKNIQMGNGK